MVEVEIAGCARHLEGASAQQKLHDAALEILSQHRFKVDEADQKGQSIFTPSVMGVWTSS